MTLLKDNVKTVVGEAHKTEDLMKQNLSTKLPRFSLIPLQLHWYIVTSFRKA